MRAFHNDQAVKDKYLARVKAHREIDNLVQGTGWKNGKGCAVGCTLESYDHAAYETELGIPEWLAHVEDKIFEGLDKETAMMWPERFLAAIRPGADLDKVKALFLVYVLESILGTFDHDKYPAIKLVIDAVIDLYRTGETDPDKFRAAEVAAWAATLAARVAAETAAAGAAVSAARAAAETAAAETAAAGASAAEAAAWAVVRATTRAAGTTAETTRAADSTTCYQQFADKLIELLAQTGGKL